MKNTVFTIPILLLLVHSCIYDKNLPVPEPPVPGEGGEVTLTFDMQLPATVSSNVSTYAVDEIIENNLEVIELLAFEIDETDPADPVERFSYQVHVTEIEDDGSTDKKKFQATVYTNSKKQRFVLIANADNEIQQLGGLVKGTSKENILSSLFWHIADGGATRTGSAFTCFPYWGESEAVLIGDNTPQVATIPMLRMLARMDVSVATQEAQDVFHLTSVHLYNRGSCGHIIPHADNLLNGRAIGATIPSSGHSVIKGPHDFTVSQAEKHAFTHSVYTFESEAATQSAEATCLVIGGVYGDDTEPTYYRVDFVNTDDSGNVTGFKHILRNHLYRVNIVEVRGSGHEGPDEAFDGKGENITVEVVEWDEGSMSDVVFDSQYLLSVSPGEMTLSREAQTSVAIKAYTDHPNGWKATIDNTLYPWITLVSGTDTGTQNQLSNLYFDIEENPATGSERTAIIKFTAGRLTYNAKVIQTIGSLLTLTVVDGNNEEVDKLIFNSGVYKNVTAQNLTVRWGSLTVVCEVTDQDQSIPAFDFGAGANPVNQSPLAGGERTFAIEPADMSASEVDSSTGNPFLEKIKDVTFTVTDGTDTETRTVTLHQINYALIAYPQSPYPVDGEVYSFKVRSNAKWTAALKSGNMVQNVITTSGDPDTGTGIDFSFRVVNNNTLSNPTATFTFTSPEDKFAPVDVIITGATRDYKDGGEANCYILQPDGDGVNIPVKHANSGITTQISSGQLLTPELIWTDHPAGLSPNGAVSSYSIEGTGPDAILKVAPGTSKGNAVIAVKDSGTGVILWSWHIWVVDYDPDTDYVTITGNWDYMDRNLGALSSTPGDHTAVGLVYQWGRKDPYPGLLAPPALTETPIYDAGGNPASIILGEVPNTENNLVNSIEHPTIFFVGASGAYADWYAYSNDNKNDQLWGLYGYVTDMGKTAYDPCPAGWRVPGVSSSSSPWWGTFSWQYSSGYIGGYNEDIGYWPMTGRKSATTGAWIDMSSSSQVGFFWHA